MNFKLSFSYQSWIPPNRENLSKLLKFYLRPLIGEIEVTELKHYSMNPARWVLPLEVKAKGSAPIEEITEALSGLERARLGVRLLEVKEASNSGHSQPSQRAVESPARASPEPTVEVSALTGSPRPRHPGGSMFMAPAGDISGADVMC